MTSSIPGAFSALGIGALSGIGVLLISVRWTPEQIGIDKIDIAQSIGMSDLTAPVVPILLGFGYFFLTFALGQISIGLGSRFRSKLFGNLDPARIAIIARSENAFLQKCFFELKATNSTFDGLGLAMAILTFGAFAVLSRQFGNFAFLIWFPFAVMSCWSMWQEANRRYREFDQVLAHYLNSSSDQK